MAARLSTLDRFCYTCDTVGSGADTIAAIATAPGQGAISIIRVSGPRSLSIADALIHCKGLRPSQRPGNTFVRGYIRHLTGSSHGQQINVDEIILLVYRAPHSYTREDMVEIQGHGGTIAARRIFFGRSWRPVLVQPSLESSPDWRF